jgi:hypothetical protein
VNALKLHVRIGSPLPNAGEGLGVRGSSRSWPSAGRSTSGGVLWSSRTQCSSLHRPRGSFPPHGPEGNRRVQFFRSFRGDGREAKVRRPTQFRTSVLGVAMLWLASLGYAQKPDVPRVVSDLVARLETDLTSTMNVAGLLAQSRRDVCALLRYYGPAAKAWQLEPALAKEMGDDELFEFVVVRASSALAGGCDLLSRYDLRNLSPETIQKSKIGERYWSETSEGHCHISHDGSYLTDSEGRPTALRNRSDLKNYWKLQKKFKSKSYQSFCFGKHWDTGTFRSNLVYLKREYGQGVEEIPECTKALRLSPGGKVYAAQLMHFTFYIQHQEGQPPKVIFLSPLAW